MKIPQKFTSMDKSDTSQAVVTCLHEGNPQWWAMPYDPKAKSPTRKVTEVVDDGSSGFNNSLIVLSPALAIPIRKRHQTFTRCIIGGNLMNLNISDWHFVECTFEGSKWERIKFSKCTFRRCHFSEAQFNHCAFVGCAFEANSASAELLRMESTMIDASAFVQGLATNLDHLPDSAQAEYQEHRLVETKENIAMLLFNSTRNEANLAFYFRAQREVILGELNNRVESKRFYFNSSSKKPKRRSNFIFFLFTSPARFERAIVRLAGRLTKWGQSLMPACIALVALIVIFAALYAATGWFTCPTTSQGTLEWVLRATLKSANISLVAGFNYDAHEPIQWQILELFNLCAGLFWYSLVVAVISRKVLR